MAREREESGVRVTGVAAPALDVDGTAVAAISITGWINRLEPDRLAPRCERPRWGVVVLRSREPA